MGTFVFFVHTICAAVAWCIWLERHPESDERHHSDVPDGIAAPADEHSPSVAHHF
jgi:hypothetical protein